MSPGLCGPMTDEASRTAIPGSKSLRFFTWIPPSWSFHCWLREPSHPSGKGPLVRPRIGLGCTDHVCEQDSFGSVGSFARQSSSIRSAQPLATSDSLPMFPESLRGADPNPMQPRKIHTKSRFGCSKCKARHVKCGEERPACVRCVKQNTPCFYEHDTRSSASPENGSIGGIAPRSGSDETTRSLELYLMHWYSTEVYESLAQTSSSLDIWQKMIPREAMNHDYLLNALFSVSCLHHAYHNPTSYARYTELALKYHCTSLAGFRQAFRQISAADPNVALIVSGLITVVALASSRDSHLTPSATVVSVRELMCGSKAIVISARDTVRRGPLHDLLVPGDRPGAPRYSGDFAPAMTRLRRRAGQLSSFVSVERRLVYEAGIGSLEGCFRAYCPQQSFSSIYAWLTLVDERLVELLQQHDPLAQLIWAHYGVLLLEMHDRWWAEGFAVRFVEGLCEALHAVEAAWVPWTEWPRQCVCALRAGAPELFGLSEDLDAEPGRQESVGL